MFTAELRAGTWRSRLALRQADEVIGHLKEFYEALNGR